MPPQMAAIGAAPAGIVHIMAGAIILITGPSGAGKSTAAALVARTYDRAVHLHTDDFWDAIVAGGIPPYLPESEAQNHTVMRVIAAAAATYAAGDYTVVVDGVIGPWMLHHFRDLPPQGRDASLHYVVLRPDRSVTLARAQQRTHPGALTDAQPIGSLWDQFADLGKLEAHVIDTTADTAPATAQSVTQAVASGAFRLAPEAG